MPAATVFYHPISLGWEGALWLVLPLSLALAIVYKTLRTNRLRRLPAQIASSFGLMVLGMTGLAVALWLVQRIFL